MRGKEYRCKKYTTLLWADVKSQKSSFIGIVVLVFLITISLCAVLSIWENANAYEEMRIDKIGYGDISYWLNGQMDSDKEALLEQLRALDEMEKVEVQEVVHFAEYDVRGAGKTTSVEGSLFFLEWSDGRYEYPVYNETLTGMEERPEDLKDGEIYVSPSFTSLYDVQVGDVVEVAAPDGSGTACYTIKGYFEDSVEGSALMGTKQALMTKNDIRKLTGWEEAAVCAFHLFKSPDDDLSIGDFQKALNEKTDLAKYVGFSYTKNAIMGFMLILQNLFSGLFLIFVIVLLVVAMVIIGHSISSSIEQDYVNMGILKALGYTCFDLRTIQLLQYLAAIALGMIPGIPVSRLMVTGINRMTVTVTGLLIPADIPFGVSFLALGAILLLFVGFICIKTARIGRITPIRAIRGGAEDVYFKSRLTASVHKKALQFWLAYRQLVSGKKQYASVCFVTALLVFFLSISGRLSAWLGPDGKGLKDVFGGSAYDLGIEYEEEGVREAVERLVDAQAGILGSYEHKMTRAPVNGVEYLMNVVSEPEYYNILEGRTCLYQNELVLTETVADELGVRIGDTVQVLFQGSEWPFIISGIYQSTNDMGANFGISKEGYERMGADDDDSYYIYYLLRDNTFVQDLSEILLEDYEKKISLNLNTWSGMDSIVATTSALIGFMYLVTVVFVFVTVMLTSSKILYKEKQDLGIYRSLGFASGSLRISFALRFCMTAAVGSVFGILFSAWFTDPLASSILKICGISHFTSSLSLFHMFLPAVVVSVLFFAFAYFAGGRIKRVEPGILIVE